MSQDENPVGTLSKIWVYPIKSCGAVSLSSARLNESGLVGDRTWQVVDDQLAVVTQRSNPTLALVDVAVGEDSSLTLSVRSGSSGGGASDEASAAVVVAPIDEAPNTLKVKALAGDEVDCADAGDEAAAFFSELLSRPVRLVGITSATARASFVTPGRNATFVDAALMTLANAASLKDLAARATESFGMERFRPNLVVDTNLPWAEDTWSEFSIGPVSFVGQLPWGRCEVPQIDQTSGERTKEPAKVLKQHRWCTQEAAEAAYPDNALYAAMMASNSLFSVACSPEVGPGQNATLNLGDTLSVRATKPAVIEAPAPLPAS